jgi:hypothetical protein
MKNKKFTYLLGFAVIAVWGIIIYRVMSATDNSDSSIAGTAAKKVVEPYNDFTIPIDTNKLTLNYKDPFAVIKSRDTLEIPVKKLIAIHPGPVPAKPVVNWSFIRYNGYIRNPGSKSLVALLSVNGKSLQLTEGESAGPVRLIKNLQDSVQVAYDGKTTFIRLQSGTL